MEKEENKRDKNVIRTKKFKIIILILIIFLLMSYLAYKLGCIEEMKSSQDTELEDVFEIIIKDSDKVQKDSISNYNKPNNTLQVKKRDNIQLVIKNTQQDNNQTVVENYNQNEKQQVIKTEEEKTEKQEINIFGQNSINGNNNKIAPLSQGVYKFTIQNDNGFSVKYNLSFSEENKYDINMKFKLKKENQYIIGNETTWVELEDISIKDITLIGLATDSYELEWVWEENNNDTYIGAQIGSYYKILIEVKAEQYE